MKTYTRLTLFEREEISRGIWARERFADIARRLGRPTSTISREVWKQVKYRWCYRASLAQKGTEERRRGRRSRKLDQDIRLQSYVHQKLKLKWSPEEIAKRICLEYPDDKTMKISHETIYQHLYCLPRGELKKELMIGAMPAETICTRKKTKDSRHYQHFRTTQRSGKSHRSRPLGRRSHCRQNQSQCLRQFSGTNHPSDASRAVESQRRFCRQKSFCRFF